MVLIWNVEISELTGSEKRKAYIYLPDSYEDNEDNRYPVLYMFDGQNVFLDSHATYGKSWGMKKYMDESKTQLIIVAIECNSDSNHGRLKEYSPYPFMAPGIGRLPGYGRKYMDWLVSELKPAIDESFRTIPDRECTMIAGSSMGGLMSLYAILRYNHVFARAACLSPSLWFNQHELERMVARSRLAEETVIYMDYGSNEFNNHRATKNEFAKVTAELIRKGAFVTSRVIPWGDHCEMDWEKQIPHFMETLLYDAAVTEEEEDESLYDDVVEYGDEPEEFDS